MNNKNFDEYNKRKEEVISLLQKAKKFYDNYDNVKSKSVSKSIEDNIEVIKSGEFEIVVVGEFSAGKSTFLNALMREKFLPSYTSETTAVINYLRHKSLSDKAGVVYYMDGRQEELDVLNESIIEKYTSTKNDDEDVSKLIKHIDLYLDSPFLENHVTLIDSPGLNGMKEGLGDITDSQIKKSHAVIFMFSAEQPGKYSDFEYLKKVKDEVDTVFLVLNKIDNIKKSENQTIETTIAKLIENYKNKFPEDNNLPEIIPIAAYPSLVARSSKNLDYPPNVFDLSAERKAELEEKSLMKAFEEKLTHFLSNSEKTITRIKEPTERLYKNLLNSLETVKNEINILENKRSDAELENKIIEINKVIESLNQKLDDSKREMRNSIKIIEKHTLEFFDSEVYKINPIIDRKIENLSVIDALDDEVSATKNIAERKIKELDRKIDEYFREEFFEQVQEKYSDIINELEDELDSTESSEISFDVKINVNARSVKVGIENFESEKKNLQNKIDSLEKEIEKESNKEYELIEKKALAEGLKEKLQRVENSQNYLESTFCPPEVEIHKKTGIRTVDRKGFLGKAIDFFWDKKTEEYYYDEKDDSERRKYLENYNREKKRLRDEVEKVENKLESCSAAGAALEISNRKKNELMAKKDKLIEDQKKLDEDNNKRLAEKYENEIKRIKKEMRNKIDEMFDEVKPALKDNFRNNRDKYTNLLQELLNQSIQKQLDDKKIECENLLKLKKDAESDKEAKIEVRNKNKSDLEELIDNTKKLMNKIKNIKVDKIEHIEI